MAIPTSFFRSETSERLREEGREEGREKGREEGRALGMVEGEARALLIVLEGRGLDVSDAVRERILGCSDPEVLRKWLDLALVVQRAEDVFGR